METACVDPILGLEEKLNLKILLPFPHRMFQDNFPILLLEIAEGVSSACEEPTYRQTSKMYGPKCILMEKGCNRETVLMGVQKKFQENLLTQKHEVISGEDEGGGGHHLPIHFQLVNTIQLPPCRCLSCAPFRAKS